MMFPRRRPAAALLLGLAFALGAPLAVGADDRAALTYPPTKRGDVVDEYHGTKVADPYRWLEGDVREDETVAAWVAAQNEVTHAYLGGIAARERIRERLTKLWNYERYGSPFKAGGRYFYYKNDGLQNQSVLYVLDELDGEPRVLIDPNGLSKDGTVALRGTYVTDDGRHMAYGVSSAGSDWQEIHVLDVATGKRLPDVTRWVKFSGASWTPDGKGFFYSRYDEPEGEAFTSENRFQKLYYHRLGSPQSDDVLVYHRPDQPEWGFGGEVTEDGRWLVISVWMGANPKNMVLYKDLSEPFGMPIELIGSFENDYTFLGNEGHLFYFRTDRDAAKGRVIAIDVRKPEPEHWSTAIPQTEDTLRGVSFVNNVFVASYLHDASTRVRLFKQDGTHVRDVELPGIGTASGFGGKRGDTETFYSFSSFATPPSIYRYDLVTGESTLLRRAAVEVDVDAFVVKQEFYESKDGTKVPMFIVHRKDLELDGNNPTLLYGYGGFNIALGPRFSVSNSAWLEMGGVYALPNLRGGGEYGEEWHQAGMTVEKQNVFDDFIAAAEYLIAKKYTSSSKLAISGGSNGGLLVGACMTQRPELFGAALPAVGVLDMLRFHKFTIGWAWVPEYGSSDDAEQFPALHAYSPYHNLKKGTAYPATMITTADTDDRVVPGHSFKFAAALQHAHAGDAPVLIRIETKAGHGAGKPTDKIIAEVADRWAFLVENLGVELPAAD